MRLPTWLRPVLIAVAILAWLGVSSAGGQTFGKLSSVQENDAAVFLPESAESTQAAQWHAKFVPVQSVPGLFVVDGLAGEDDLAKIQAFADAAAAAPIAGDPKGRTVDDTLLAPPTVIPSEDGAAALVTFSVSAEAYGELVGEDTLGEFIASTIVSVWEAQDTGLDGYLTGAMGFVADLLEAFAGIDGVLLLVALGVVLLILLIVYRSPVLPFLVLTYVSFVSYIHVPGAKTWELLTLDNYRTNLNDGRTYRALQNSLFLATGGATVCMLLAALTAWVTTKTRVAGRGFIEGLTFIPWAFPGTALAIGLLWTYVYVPLPIYGTLWILLIGYITRFLPYGLRSMTSTIVQLHDPYLNIAQQIAAGVDFDARYATRLFGGKFSTQLQATRNLIQKTEFYPGQGLQNYNGTLGYPGFGSGPKWTGSLDTRFTTSNDIPFRWGVEYIGPMNSDSVGLPLFMT